MIMNIENPDALRVWLSTTLAPICDADPAALAKYVMAILKKDKPEQDLKDFCVEQLDVFLQKETKPFVDQLFSVIKDRTYLASPAKSMASSSATSVASPAVSSSASAPVQKSSPVAAVSSTESPSSARGGISAQSRSTSGSGRPARSGSRSGRKRSPSPSSQRAPDRRSSRSRSKERTSGSGPRFGTSDRRHERRPSREQQRRDTDKENRTNRSRKSPVQVATPSSSAAGPSTESGRSRGGTSSRKIDRSVDSDESIDSDKPDKKRKKLRCRDFDEKGFCMRGDLCPYDHGPDPVVVDEIALPTMISMTSGSAAKPPSTPGGTPNFAVPPPGYGTGPPGVHPPPPGLETVPYQQAEAYNPEAPSISVAVPPPGYSRPPPPAAVGAGAPHHPPPMWTRQPPPGLYLTQPPAVGAGGPLPVPLPVPLPSGLMIQRPTATPGMTEAPDAGGPRTVLAAPVAIPSTIPFRPAIGGKRPFASGPGGPGGQAGPRGATPYDKNNCTLEVRRIPSHLNTITKLNEHFSQFGQVVNMQVRYENDPEAALVTYATRPQAVSAYKSTAPILNNRFIKIFWHDKDAAAEAGGAGSTASAGKPSIKDRLGAPPNPQSQFYNDGNSSMKYRAPPPPETDEDGNHRAVLLTTSGNLTRTIYNPVALAAAVSQKAADKSGNGSESTTPTTPPASSQDQKPPLPQPQQQKPPMVHPKMMRKQQKLQEAMKKSLELQKAKADLLKKQVEQQKLLLAQLEKCTNASQKKEIVKTIKILEKTIKASTEDLSKAAKQASIPMTKTKEALEKELLDMELELIRQKQSGGDTSDLQRRLTEIRLELTAMLARSLGPSGSDQKSFGGNAPGQMVGGPPRKRRAAPETAVLDKRPKDLSIGGFQVDEKDALIEHLQHYGMLEDIEFHHVKGDHQACRATVTYKTRREAETALANGTQFRNRQLAIHWAHQRTTSVSDAVGGAVGNVGTGVDAVPTTEMTAEEILASLDDEDEEESEEEDEDGDGEEHEQDDDDDEPSTGRDWKRAGQ